MQVICPTCPYCHQSSTIEVDPASYGNWRNGMLIQRAFPNMSIADRERLITGIHGECWNKIFPPEDEE